MQRISRQKEGMVELVRREYEAGSKLVIFTASEKSSVEILLDRLGIRKCFYDIYTVYDIGLKRVIKTVILRLSIRPA